MFLDSHYIYMGTPGTTTFFFPPGLIFKDPYPIIRNAPHCRGGTEKCMYRKIEPYIVIPAAAGIAIYGTLYLTNKSFTQVYTDFFNILFG